MRPLAYFITFRTYATWLPGDARGFVTRHRSGYLTPTRSPQPYLEREVSSRQAATTLLLDAAKRGAVEAAIREHCAHRHWLLHALNVRTNHVHNVLTAPQEPEHALRS
jgi:hypothetical protein